MKSAALALGVFVVGALASSASLAASGEDDRPRLLVLEFKGEGVEAASVRALQDLVSASFSSSGRFSTLNAADISEMIALEAEKQTVGCDSASCMAEVAGAMDARFVVTGRLSRLGSLFVLTVGLFEAQRAVTIGQETVNSATIEELAGMVDVVAKKLTHLAFGEEVPADVGARVDTARAPAAAPSPAPAATDDEGGGASYWLGVAGIGALGVGAVMVFGAFVVFTVSYFAFFTATSPGWSKWMAVNVGVNATRVLFPIGMISLVVGAVLAPTSLVLGFVEE